MCKRKLWWPALVVLSLILCASPATVAAEVQGDGEERVWTVAVIADLNSRFGSTSHNEHVHAAARWLSEDLQPDLVICAGDMVAGQRASLDYPAMWEAFHEAVTDRLAAAGIPLAVSPGNHDASEQPPFWKERIEFVRQWKKRRPHLNFVDDANYPFYYAFEVGPALFISMDGTGVGDLDERQRLWIDETLAENDHLEVSILFTHVPQYAVAQGREHEIFADEQLAEILARHEVDMMVSGHHHAYYPARRDGTIFLHASALGDGVRMLVGERQRRPRNVAVIRFDESGLLGFEAYESPDFTDVVDHRELPESVGEGELQIWRYDLGSKADDEAEPDS